MAQKQLDPSNSALLGAPDKYRGKIKDCTERPCDGCGAKVYLSKSTIAPAKDVAFRNGKALYILCWNCAQPWIDDLATVGGLADATCEEGAKDLIEAIDEARTRIANQN